MPKQQRSTASPLPPPRLRADVHLDFDSGNDAATTTTTSSSSNNNDGLPFSPTHKSPGLAPPMPFAIAQNTSLAQAALSIEHPEAAKRPSAHSALSLAPSTSTPSLQSALSLAPSTSAAVPHSPPRPERSPARPTPTSPRRAAILPTRPYVYTSFAADAPPGQQPSTADRSWPGTFAPSPFQASTADRSWPIIAGHGAGIELHPDDQDWSQQDLGSVHLGAGWGQYWSPKSRGGEAAAPGSDLPSDAHHRMSWLRPGGISPGARSSASYTTSASSGSAHPDRGYTSFSDVSSRDDLSSRQSSRDGCSSALTPSTDPPSLADNLPSAGPSRAPWHALSTSPERVDQSIASASSSPSSSSPPSRHVLPDSSARRNRQTQWTAERASESTHSRKTASRRSTSTPRDLERATYDTSAGSGSGSGPSPTTAASRRARRKAVAITPLELFARLDASDVRVRANPAGRLNGSRLGSLANSNYSFVAGGLSSGRDLEPDADRAGRVRSAFGINDRPQHEPQQQRELPQQQPQGHRRQAEHRHGLAATLDISSSSGSSSRSSSGSAPRHIQPVDATQLRRSPISSSFSHRPTSLPSTNGDHPLQRPFDQHSRVPPLILDVRPIHHFLAPRTDSSLSTGRIKGSVNVNIPNLLIKRFAKGNTGAFSLESLITTEMGKRRFSQVVDAVMSDRRRSRDAFGVSSRRTATDSPRSIAPDQVPDDEPPPSSGRRLNSVSSGRFWESDVVVVYEEPADDSGSPLSSTVSFGQLASSRGDEGSAEAGEALVQVLEHIGSSPDGGSPESGGEGSGGGVYYLQGGLRAAKRAPGADDWFEDGIDESDLGLPETNLLNAPHAGMATLTLSAPPAGELRRASSGTLRPPGRTMTLNVTGLSRDDPPKSPAINLSPSGLHSGPPEKVLLSRSPSPAATLSAVPTRPPGRPSLARLDTSERIKTVKPMLEPVNGPRRGSAGSLRLQVNTAIPRSSPARCATISTSSPTRVHYQDAHRHGLRSASSGSDWIIEDEGCLTPYPAPAFREGQSNMPPPSPSGFGEMGTSLLRPSPMRSPMDPSTPTLSARGTEELSFSASEILPGFLYLGPDVAREEDVEELERLGVKRVLNMAYEIEDGGAQLGLKRRFEKYLKIPMKDNVEATGVQKSVRDACQFLDDARLHSSPVYVHCKAGKSRSVTVVMAYLIHANHWSLKRSYAYVVNRRNAVSPNIGFVAELMRFEEMELNLTKSNGIMGYAGEEDDENEGGHGKGAGAGAGAGAAGTGTSSSSGEKRSNKRDPHIRDSLPPVLLRSPNEFLGYAPESNSTLGDDPVSSSGGGYPLSPSDEPNSLSTRHTSHTQTSLMVQASLPTNPRAGAVQATADGSRPVDHMSETEIKGVDGRYRARRPPVDEVRLAPGRRATLAGLGSAPLTFGELVAGPEVREERERERAKAEAGEEEEKATGEVKAPSER